MIVIAPYAKPMLNGLRNPKEYPYWEELIKTLPGKLVQIGMPWEKQLVEDFRNLPFPALKELVKEMDFFISIDSFFPHFCHNYNRHGIVLWGPSDPKLFGYEENLNLLGDESYLRPRQFANWEEDVHNPYAFVRPEKVLEAVNILLPLVTST